MGSDIAERYFGHHAFRAARSPDGATDRQFGGKGMATR